MVSFGYCLFYLMLIFLSLQLIEDCAEDEYDVIALPGGMPGAEHLRDSDVLISMLRKQQESARIVAAICASPAVVLETHGLLAGGKKATSHPGFSQHLSNQSLVNQRVVIDGNIITSRGPGTAFEFALALVKVLYGEDTMKKVAQPMVMYEGWDSSI